MMIVYPTWIVKVKQPQADSWLFRVSEPRLQSFTEVLIFNGMEFEVTKEERPEYQAAINPAFEQCFYDGCLLESGHEPPHRNLNGIIRK